MYASSTILRIVDAPKNKKIVFFGIDGFAQGNNSYTYLAVFDKTQKANVVEGEIHEYFGPIHFRLIGFVQLGGHHFGSVEADKIVIDGDIITVPISYSGSDLLMLNGEILKVKPSAVNIKIYNLSLIHI